MAEFQFYASTMVLKQCHTRLNVFALSQATSTDRASFCRSLSWKRSSTEPSWPHFKSSASFVSSLSDTNRARRQAGLRLVHLSGKGDVYLLSYPLFWIVVKCDHFTVEEWRHCDCWFWVFFLLNFISTFHLLSFTVSRSTGAFIQFQGWGYIHSCSVYLMLNF